MAWLAFGLSKKAVDDRQARPDSVCVRDGLAGWGGGIRTSAYRIGICQDSQPRGQDSNLRIERHNRADIIGLCLSVLTHSGHSMINFAALHGTVLAQRCDNVRPQPEEGGP
jgi:hypothetical protein